MASDFIGAPKKGYMYLTVQFTDLSVGVYDSYYWSFGDGRYSTEQNPEHFYNIPGFYTVTLTVSNINDTFTETKYNYIEVNSTITYDSAPDPDKVAFLWGTSLVKKMPVGVELKMINR